MVEWLKAQLASLYGFKLLVLRFSKKKSSVLQLLISQAKLERRETRRSDNLQKKVIKNEREKLPVCQIYFGVLLVAKLSCLNHLKRLLTFEWNSIFAVFICGFDHYFFPHVIENA